MISFPQHYCRNSDGIDGSCSVWSHQKRQQHLMLIQLRVAAASNEFAMHWEAARLTSRVAATSLSWLITTAILLKVSGEHLLQSLARRSQTEQLFTPSLPNHHRKTEPTRLYHEQNTTNAMTVQLEPSFPFWLLGLRSTYCSPNEYPSIGLRIRKKCELELWTSTGYLKRSGSMCQGIPPGFAAPSKKTS